MKKEKKKTLIHPIPTQIIQTSEKQRLEKKMKDTRRGEKHL